jgi:hypothetical protein
MLPGYFAHFLLAESREAALDLPAKFDRSDP